MVKIVAMGFNPWKWGKTGNKHKGDFTLGIAVEILFLSRFRAKKDSLRAKRQSRAATGSPTR